LIILTKSLGDRKLGTQYKAMFMKKTPRVVISAIAAMAENRAIGINNRLPWHLPADLKHFKALTSGHPILMGRKTYQSIGRPLPHRMNIIITRDLEFQAPGCIVVNSIEQAVGVAEVEDSNEIFIIGGAEVYQQLMPHIERIYLTIVHHAFEADTFFPEIDMKEWREVAREDHVADEANEFDFSFITLEKLK
jgi:dihydrofolate reductase